MLSLAPIVIAVVIIGGGLLVIGFCNYLSEQLTLAWAAQLGEEP